MTFLLLSFGSVFEAMVDVLDWIDSVIDDINSIFVDVDFTILYDWLPSDVMSVVQAVLVLLFFLALIGLLKKAILFLG